jgi:hypothetical protein
MKFLAFILGVENPMVSDEEELEAASKEGLRHNYIFADWLQTPYNHIYDTDLHFTLGAILVKTRIIYLFL